MNWQTLIEQLHAEGLLEATNVEQASAHQESGYGRWLSMVGAWIAALFLMSFLAAFTASLLENAWFSGIVGGVLLVIGIAMSRDTRLPSQVMLQQFALIACVLGGVLITKALSGFDQSAASLALAALCVPCLLTSKDSAQRHVFAVAGVGFVCAFLRGMIC